METLWTHIEEFPNYLISNFGEIINETTGRVIQQSTTLQGAVKVNLIKDGCTYTRSLKSLVANAFIEKPPRIGSFPFNTPMHLDQNQENNRADNLVWRPRWFAWKYARQFIESNINNNRGPIYDLATGEVYETFFEAAIANGIFVNDIRSSIVARPENPTFPTGQLFDFVDKRIR